MLREHVELVLVEQRGYGDQRGDGIVAVEMGEEADVGGVEAGVRVPEELERRAGGAGDVVDEVVEVGGVDSVGPAAHVDAEEEAIDCADNVGGHGVLRSELWTKSVDGWGRRLRRKETWMGSPFQVRSVHVAAALLVWILTTASALRRTRAGRWDLQHGRPREDGAVVAASVGMVSVGRSGGR